MVFFAFFPGISHSTGFMSSSCAFFYVVSSFIQCVSVSLCRSVGLSLTVGDGFVDQKNRLAHQKPDSSTRLDLQTYKHPKTNKFNLTKNNQHLTWEKTGNVSLAKYQRASCQARGTASRSSLKTATARSVANAACATKMCKACFASLRHLRK